VRDLHVSADVVRRLPKPPIEALARSAVDVPNAKVDEPVRCLVQNLPVQLGSWLLRTHAVSLPGSSSRTSRHCLSARARYFFAVGRDTPSSRPISSIESPANRCSMNVVDIFGGSCAST